MSLSPLQQASTGGRHRANNDIHTCALLPPHSSQVCFFLTKTVKKIFSTKNNNNNNYEREKTTTVAVFIVLAAGTPLGKLNIKKEEERIQKRKRKRSDREKSVTRLMKWRTWSLCHLSSVHFCFVCFCL